MAALLILSCLLAATTTLSLVSSASYNQAISIANYENLRICLLSWGIPSSSIIGRDNPLDSERYLDLNWQWNTLNGYIAPFTYLQARSAEDVSSGVRCGNQNGVRVVAKGGGHSYLKYGFGDADSFIIDLALLNDVVVHVDENTGQHVATIGAGTRQGKILAELWTAGGWMLPVGNCPTVGFAGYILGGGYGFYSRWLGLGVDHLLEVTMVSATGTIQTVNNITDPELFWALRGGGGGNFGIVTSLTLRLRHAPDQVISVEVEWSWDQFPAWFRSWQSWVATRPPGHLAAVPIFNPDSIGMFFHSMNGSYEEVKNLITTQFPPLAGHGGDITFTFPEFVVFRAQGYWPADEVEPLTHISQLVNLTRHNALGWKRVKSIFVDRQVTSDEDIAALQTLFHDYLQWSGTFMEQQGGAISDLDASDTAYVHRSPTVYGLQLLVYAEDGKEPVESVEAMERFFEGTKAIWNHTASYQNYMDQELPDYLQRYYGDNLERLVAVKRRVDPNNVFHHPKSIPSQLTSSFDQ